MSGACGTHAGDGDAEGAWLSIAPGKRLSGGAWVVGDADGDGAAVADALGESDGAAATGSETRPRWLPPRGVSANVPTATTASAVVDKAATRLRRRRRPAARTGACSGTRGVTSPTA